MLKAVIFGAGNIGRGFAGQLFSESGYEVVFIDVNMTIIDRMNKDKCYPIYIVSDDSRKEIMINNVRGVDGRNMEAVASEVASADLMATAVGMQALAKVASSIAYGLKARWLRGNLEPVNIILCENMLNVEKYMNELITSLMDPQEKELFEKQTGLVEASIGRMVPVATPEMQEGNPLQIYVEAYSKLPVDKDGFKGEIPRVKNMVPYSPFDFYVQRKLYMHNMGHAIAAYLGFLKNYQYIWEAIGDKRIKEIVAYAFDESAKAMSLEHNVSIEELLAHKDDLIQRFGNKALGDTVERVGKDPIRKLSIDDRLSGAAKLCEKHCVLPRHISLGIAAAFLYKSLNDPAVITIQAFIKDTGIKTAITQYCGINPEEKSFGLVLDFYNKLKQGETLETII